MRRIVLIVIALLALPSLAMPAHHPLVHQHIQDHAHKHRMKKATRAANGGLFRPAPGAQ